MAPNEVCPICEEGGLILNKVMAEYIVEGRQVALKVECHSHICNSCGVDVVNPGDMRFNANSYKDALAAL